MQDFTPLQWDSAFFGFPVARILPTKANSDQLGRILSELRHKVALAYWMTDAADLESLAAAKCHSGLFVGRRITYVLKLKTLAPEGATRKANIVTEYEESVPNSSLECLAIQSGKYSRFNIDRRISKTKFEEMYKIWIRRSVSGELADKVLVVRGEGDSISAMATVGYKNGRGDIGLLAVDSRSRGKGHGSALMLAARIYFLSKGYKCSQVVTQADNLAACALYRKSGYVAEKSENVFHLWLH
jgi:dTDP-4-amino-4,6-dideoxy-D-galactose acyltransferase